TGRVFGKNLSVIDTPAILDSEQEIRILCEEVMCSSRHKLFLVVVKIDRFTEEQKNSVDATIRTIGDDGMKNSLMLFTNGDTLETMSMSLDGFLNEDPNSPLPELVQRFAGFHVFNNENGGDEQVKELLEKSGLPLNSE
ncbi:GTPase IMAP family member 8-like, partial [Scomber scombrus]